MSASKRGGASEEAVAYYDEHARELFDRYQSVSFTQVHADLLPLLPPAGARVLDIGAGSGRDAIALARAGYVTTAVEPSSRLRMLARQHCGTVPVRWIDDALPKLGAVVSEGAKYDFVLLSAVWMHVPPAEQNEAMRVLASLLAPNGKLAVSLRVSDVDDGDRLFYPTSREDVEAVARRFGLAPVSGHKRTDDALGREGVSWDKVVLTATTQSC